MINKIRKYIRLKTIVLNGTLNLMKSKNKTIIQKSELCTLRKISDEFGITDAHAHYLLKQITQGLEFRKLKMKTNEGIRYVYISVNEANDLLMKLYRKAHS